eukprot:TRINITY_DN27616_c0_g1_i8.p1 TRINITY_DN27616_c0_g1~~TRINITY_DN27616_c0_g1_i8.p1  ORF type:complete len:174 (-),score=7.49 TRINITY_DN27616_c0_g1_i8:309-830(-)
MKSSTFLDPWTLAQQLEHLPSDTPMCLGNKHWQDCDDRLHLEGASIKDGCQANFSWLGGGYGILCNNAAMRRMYRHLERGMVSGPLFRWGPVYSDIVISRCINDLRIPKGHLDHYSAKAPLHFMQGYEWLQAHWPVSVHKVRHDSDFALLDALQAPMQALSVRVQRSPPDFRP